MREDKLKKELTRLNAFAISADVMISCGISSWKGMRSPRTALTASLLPASSL
jgi:hypothetical protein